MALRQGAVRETSALPSLEEVERELGGRGVPHRFTDAELIGLPEPVKSYLLSSLSPGVPLATAVRLEMRGSIKIGRWLPFRAEEVLAPHEGFVWAARVAGVIRGSDAFIEGRGGMSWKLFGLVPIVRAGGEDYARSATGRFASEAMWLPTVLLPRFGVSWRARGSSDITASFSVGDVPLDLRFAIAEDGGLRSMVFDRWRAAEGGDPAGVYPFGGDFTGYRSFDGLTIPSEGRFGWFYGTDRWSEGEFFRYEITGLRMLF